MKVPFSERRSFLPLFFGIIWRLLQGRRLSVFWVYLLMIANQAIILCTPWAIGYAINEKSRMSIWLTALFMLCAIALGYFQRIYDTQVYTGIYTEWATKVVMQQRELGVDDGKIVSRASLSRELVDFLEHEMPGLFAISISIVGPFWVMLVFDARLGLLAAVALTLVLIGGYYSAKQSLRLNHGLNNQLEKEVDVLVNHEISQVRNHYENLAIWRVKLSNLQALSFSSVQIFGVSMLLIILFMSTAESSAGTTFAIITNTLSYMAALSSIPMLLQQWSRLSDITARLGATYQTGEQTD